MFLNKVLIPDSQNWIVFQPNIIIDAKLGKFVFQLQSVQEMLHLSVFNHYDKGSYHLTKKYERFPM